MESKTIQFKQNQLSKFTHTKIVSYFFRFPQNTSTFYIQSKYMKGDFYKFMDFHLGLVGIKTRKEGGVFIFVLMNGR